MTHKCSDSGHFRSHGERGRESTEDRRNRRESRRWRRRERKERVLHTRVSQKLSDDIRKLADDMRVPVSNLVRNVLEEAFSVVEEMSDDVGEILDDVINEAEGATERFRRFQADRRARARAAEELDETERRASRSSRTASPGREAPGEAAGIREEEVERAPADPAPEADEPRPMAGAFADVIAWQPVILNAPQRCARTGQPIRAGSEGFMGVTAQGFGGVYLSREGLDELHGQ